MDQMVRSIEFVSAIISFLAQLGFINVFILLNYIYSKDIHMLYPILGFLFCKGCIQPQPLQYCGTGILTEYTESSEIATLLDYSKRIILNGMSLCAQRITDTVHYRRIFFLVHFYRCSECSTIDCQTSDINLCITTIKMRIGEAESRTT